MVVVHIYFEKLLIVYVLHLRKVLDRTCEEGKVQHFCEDANINSEIRSKIISVLIPFKKKQETNWNFTCCQMLYFMIVSIPYINLLNSSLIKEEYGAFKINNLTCRKSLRLNSFPMWCINNWNSLDEGIVCSDSVMTFKTILDKPMRSDKVNLVNTICKSFAGTGKARNRRSQQSTQVASIIPKTKNKITYKLRNEPLTTNSEIFIHYISIFVCPSRPTGDQEIAGSVPTGSGNILSWRLIMKYFLQSLSPLRWFKSGNAEILVNHLA